MPTTVTEIFKHFNLKIDGQVKWNEQINSNKHGIYVVAITDNREKLITNEQPSFCNQSINRWLNLISDCNKRILVDSKKATTESIKMRLSHFWLPDETILYIGKAGPTPGRTLKVRVNEYYKTILGCKKKHAGGHWLKTLSCINTLNVYYSETDPEVEEHMIKFFADNVSQDSIENIHDKLRPYPFANKELNKSQRKKHGLSNQCIDCRTNGI